MTRAAETRVVTLLTDFGDRDGFVGVLKGVILRIAGTVSMVDLAHDISAGDIEMAAFVLGRSYRSFPPATVHVVVVDPGVGSSRQPLLVEAGGAFFVAPDNGVLQWVFWQEPKAVVRCLQNSQYFLNPVSHTFHGRDIFAPVAAHLIAGAEPVEMGPLASSWLQPPKPVVIRDGDRLQGQVIAIDRFGNCITNLEPVLWQNRGFVASRAGGTRVPGLYSSYADVACGNLLNLIGSHGFLEISLRDGSAAGRLQVQRGDAVSAELG